MVAAVVRSRCTTMAIIDTEEGVALGSVHKVGVLHERTTSDIGVHADRTGLWANELQFICVALLLTR